MATRISSNLFGRGFAKGDHARHEPDVRERRQMRLPLQIAESLVYLAIALVLNYFAGTFATDNAGNSVTDILLDHLPVLNVDFIFIEGALSFWILMAIVCLRAPARIPFVVKTLALFVVVRSGFIIMTHLGPIPKASKVDSNEVIKLVTFGDDYFFSGHTGAPFLMALIFWRDAKLRWLCLIASAIFAVSVLLGHLHYSIDVFAAFFISYGICDMGKALFPRERTLFEASLQGSRKATQDALRPVAQLRPSSGGAFS